MPKRSRGVMLRAVARSICLMLTLLLAALLFAAGVGLLRLRRWGAGLAVGYALARIGWSVAAAVVAFIGPFSGRPPPDALTAEQAELMKARFVPVALTEMCAGLLFSVAFAVILLCLLSRKTYRESLS